MLSQARRFRIATLIETGTFRGDMLEAARCDFSRIYSIEIDQRLHGEACDRFRAYPHITLIRGDSGVELRRLLRSMTAPCLFWLDGHYCGNGTGRGDSDTPIMQELRAIADEVHRRDVILIDDARLFTGGDGYPTLDELRVFIHSRLPSHRFQVEHDIIRLLPGDRRRFR